MTTGFLVRPNATDITDPVAFETFVFQTTTAGGRVAGGIYVWNGSAWITPPNTAGGASGITQLTGDVTAGPGTGSQAATIAANAVTSTKILDQAVTLAKIVDAPSNSILLGSGAAGSGNPYEPISLGTNLSMSGTTLNASGGGGGSTHENYPVADVVDALATYSHAAGNFTVGVQFFAISDATLDGFSFAYDGFASKTMKWTFYDLGYSVAGSTVIETSTVAVAAAGVYTITLSTPLVLEPGKFYTIALYINDGSNSISYTPLLAGWQGGSPQTRVTVGPIAWNDTAVFGSGDVKPTNGSGSNAVPCQLNYS